MQSDRVFYIFSCHTLKLRVLMSHSNSHFAAFLFLWKSLKSLFSPPIIVEKMNHVESRIVEYFKMWPVSDVSN